MTDPDDVAALAMADAIRALLRAEIGVRLCVARDITPTERALIGVYHRAIYEIRHATDPRVEAERAALADQRPDPAADPDAGSSMTLGQCFRTIARDKVVELLSLARPLTPDEQALGRMYTCFLAEARYATHTNDQA